MAIGSIAVAVKPIAELLLKVANLISPDKRDEVNKRKALNFGEKYIFTNEEIGRLKKVKPWTSKQERALDRLQRKLKRYRDWYFQYN